MSRRYYNLLVARASFLEGVGRLWDFGGTLTEFNRCPNGFIADSLALSSDWAAVGADLNTAIHRKRLKRHDGSQQVA